MFTLVFCLQTNEPAPHSDAFVVDFAWEFICTQLSNHYCPITTVQYRILVYGHVVGIMRCDWPFTVGYIIMVNSKHQYFHIYQHTYRCEPS